MLSLSRLYKYFDVRLESCLFVRFYFFDSRHPPVNFNPFEINLAETTRRDTTFHNNSRLMYSLPENSVCGSTAVVVNS